MSLAQQAVKELGEGALTGHERGRPIVGACDHHGHLVGGG